MKHQHQFEISGRHYEIAHFTPTKSLRLLVTLGKILGQPLSALFAADDDLSLEAVAPIIVGALTERLEETLVINTVKELLADTRIKESGGDWMNLEFDLHFQGRLMQMFKALGEVLKFQYADFFEGASVKGLLRKVTPKAAG